MTGNPVEHAVEVSASDEAIIVRLANGGVRAWGKNTWGRIEIPQSPPVATQVAAGEESFGVVTEDGRVIRWGRLPMELDLSFEQQQVREITENYILPTTRNKSDRSPAV